MMQQRNQSGFTLVELLLAIVFFSFILIFATASYVRINRAYVRGANIKLVQEDARKTVSEISTALRNSGSNAPIIKDNDNVAQCDPRTTNLNDLNNIACRHRVCIGTTAFAWNQAVFHNTNTANYPGSEVSWYLFVDTSQTPPVPYPPEAYHPVYGPDPFSIVKTEIAGLSDSDCSANVVFNDSTELVDGNRVMVQDLDIVPFEDIPNTYRVSVTLSTIDSNPNDNQDLNYQTVPSDSQSSGNEFKASQCYTDKGSQEFCYVETLSTIVTIR